MASTIKIKRSGTTTAPVQLASGELAYSWASGIDKLYIGWGSETIAGVADNISAIGGKYFTDMLDHAAGTLTPSSAVIVDANSKINVLNVDDIRLDGNVLSTTNTNGDLYVTPNGTGKTVVSNLYIGDPATSLAAYVQAITGGTIAAGTGIDIVTASGTSTISAKIATTAQLGIASFSATNFDVASGAVSIKAGGVPNTALVNSTVTVGTTAIALGSAATSIAGLTQLTVDSVRIDGSTVSIHAGNSDLILAGNGTGNISVSNQRITNVATPINASDAATKGYVDALEQGLAVKSAVKAATTANIVATYNNGTAGVGATLTIPAAATLTIDGITSWALGDGVLVKNQTNTFENGRYTVTQVGNASLVWILTRTPTVDTSAEIPSSYVFVQMGSTLASTGWVAVVADYAAFDVGTDAITWTQFSGAGTYIAGSGLTLSGNTFNVGGTANRITVNADTVDIASTYVGQTSITTLGTIATGTWNATAIAATRGGTGQTTYAKGDLLYASAANTLSKLAIGVEGKIFQVGATGVPVWADIDGGVY